MIKYYYENKISELKDKLENGLQRRGLTHSESEIVTKHLIDAEMMGKKLMA